MQVNIKNFEVLKKVYLKNNLIVTNLHESILKYQKKLNELEQNIQKEIFFSENLFREAQMYEQQQFMILSNAQTELERALIKEERVRENNGPDTIAEVSDWVERVRYRCFKAERRYQQAKKNRINMERRVELVKMAYQKTKMLNEETKKVFNIGYKEIEYRKEILNSRLSQAYQSLARYFSNEEYILNLKIIKPNNLKEMLGLDNEKKRAYFSYLYNNDKQFQEQVNKLKKEYKDAKTYLEKDKILRKIRQTLAGNFVEKYVETSLSGLGDIKTQHREEMDDTYSKVDIRIENLKKPFILGKGECGKYVKEGGTLSIEIKAGKKEYLKSQKEHLIFQTKAHKKSSDASLILTTKNIHDLKDEDEFRQIFKDECVSIMAMLPRKEEIDQILIDSMELKND